MKIVKLLIFSLFILSACSLIGKDLAPTPPMGWNSWNSWGKQDINEKVVRDTIDAMAANGLKEAGYIYVVIDGGWRDIKHSPGGELLVHPTKFPNGIKPLADYVHQGRLHPFHFSTLRDIYVPAKAP